MTISKTLTLVGAAIVIVATVAIVIGVMYMQDALYYDQRAERYQEAAEIMQTVRDAQNQQAAEELAAENAKANVPQTPEQAAQRITTEQFQQQYTELKQQTAEQP